MQYKPYIIYNGKTPPLSLKQSLACPSIKKQVKAVLQVVYGYAII